MPHHEFSQPSAQRCKGICIAAALAVAACSSAAPSDANVSFPSDPQEVASSDGALTVELRSAPTQPAVRGANQIELRFLAADGVTPIDGLELSMVPFMPAMGHGSSVDPSVTPEGDGRYRFRNVVLAMPGEWELRTTISGAQSDYVAPKLDIQ